MKLLFFLAASFIFLSSGYGKVSCPEIDLSKEAPLSKRTQIHQGDSDWCCAFAYVDALALKYGKNFSPIDIAIKTANLRKGMNGCHPITQVAKAINASPKLCLDDGPLTGINSEFDKDIDRNSIGYQLDEIKEIRNALSPKITANNICQIDHSFNSVLFKNIKNIREIAEAVYETVEEDYYAFLNKLSEKNCKNYQEIKVQTENIELFDSDPLAIIKKNPVESIIAHLKNKRSPILTIDSSTLVKTEKNSRAFLGINRIGNHAINILGTSQKDGKCYFKVRDSVSGGSYCLKTRKTEDSLVCSGTDRDMTYEVEVNKLIHAAKSAIVIK